MSDFYSNVKELTDSEFKTISSYIEKNVGIKLPPVKRLMIQSRLFGRLKTLKMQNFKEYLEYVFSSSDGIELTHMIDTLTTNLTHFFREADHFNYMTNNTLPELAARGKNNVEIWSAGCSTGEEPYTISIVMQEFMRKNPGKFGNYSILATDVSTKVLTKAANGVYAIQSLENMTLEMKRRYFLKGKNQSETPIVKVKKELSDNVTFHQLNFMDENFNFRKEMDIIFCRNVLIYFDKPTQKAVIEKFLKYLPVGGYLFLGHSETIFGMDLPLETVFPMVFRKIN